MSRASAGGTLRLASAVAVLVAVGVTAVLVVGGRAGASRPLQTRPNPPLRAGAQVGPEEPVSDPVYVSAAPSQSFPKIACDESNCLVVWQEDRGGQFDDVYASRVAPDGTVLDPHGIPVATTQGSELNPAVAFDGTNYLVTWTASTFPDGDIYGARVSQSGDVLDPEGFPISTAPELQDYSALAFDGTNYLVVWMSGHYPADIYAARVSPSGTVLDPSGIPVSTAAGEQGLPAVAFDGQNYLVVWEDGRNPSTDVFGARVDPSGTVLDPQGVSISSAAGSQWAPKLAFDGTNYLVAWQDGRNGDGTTFDVYGARVTSGGSVLDAAGIPISTAPDSQLTPAVGFGGTAFLVAWTDQRAGSAATYGARVSSDGVVLDPSGVSISTNGGNWPAIAFDGTNYLIAWSTPEAGGYKRDIFASRVSASGSVLDPDALPIDRLAPSEQNDPVLAFDGTNYLAVWQDYRAGNSDIYAGRLTQHGARLDGTGIPVAVGAADEINPTVTFDGADYLLAWEVYHSDHERDVFGARVSPAGTVLDPSGFAISAGVGAQGDPAAASDGSKSLVVWDDSRSNPEPLQVDTLHGPPPPPPPPPPPRWDVYGTRVDRDGSVLDPSGIPVRAGGTDQLDPALAFDGVNYVAVWADGPNYGENVYGGRVTPDGAVLDPAGIPISTAAGTQDAPAVASAGEGQSLVVWQDDRTLDLDVHGARLSADGTVLDPSDIPISTAVGTQSFPAVAFDGLDYLAGWGDNRGGDDFNPDFKVYGARVGTSGSVLDPSGIVISDSPLWGPPSIARGEQGAALTYTRLATEPAYGGALRAFLRLFSEDLPPPPPPPPAPPPPPVEPPPPPPPPPVRCHVPRAVGLRLAAAKRRIRRAHCSVGRVTRAHSRLRLRGRVVRQSPRAGTVRRRGYPVRLVVGRR